MSLLSGYYQTGICIWLEALSNNECVHFIMPCCTYQASVCLFICKQDFDSLSSVFGTLKSVTRCYLALSSLGLKTACLSVYVALAVRAHICTCNRELCFLVNIGLLPRVIGSDPLICWWLVEVIGCQWPATSCEVYPGVDGVSLFECCVSLWTALILLFYLFLKARLSFFPDVSKA